MPILTNSGRGRGRARIEGGALLAVLWLSAALSAIAFSVATTVRGEIERASTFADGVRAHYLATGAIDRGVLHMVWGQRGRPADLPPGAPFYSRDAPLMRFPFPTGEAIVEVIPETARLSLNEGRPEDFVRLLLTLGVEPPRAQEIAAAIVDWRTPGAGGPLEGYYLSLAPSFRARHASFEEVEEVLLVKGMTPEIFYGTYVRDRSGRLVRTGAFKDCVSVFGTVGPFDANSAEPALLASLGMPPEGVARLVDIRRRRPFVSQGDLAQLAALAGPAFFRLRVGGNTIYTVRATARARLPGGGFSDLRRTVSAQVKIFEPGHRPAYSVLRWDEHATSEVAQWQ